MSGHERSAERPPSRKGAPSAARLGRTGRAAATYVLLAGLQRGMLLLILPFISRVMSPAEYGAASMLTAAALLLVAIIASPLDALVFRMVPRSGEDLEASGVLRAAGLYCYVLLPMIAAWVAAGLVVFSPTILGVSGFIWAVEILAIGFQPAMSVFALPMVQTQQDLSRFAWLAGSSVVILAISKMMLVVVWQLGVLGWVISDLTSAVFSAIVAIALVRPPRGRVTCHHVRVAARFAVPLIPHKASYWAITSLSRPALAVVSTLTQVGLFSLGLNVASTVSLVIAEINRATQPRYSRETFPAPTHLTYTPVRWQIVLAVSLPAAIGAALALVGQWVFPEPYWPSFTLAGILLVGQVAYGLYPISTNYLVLTAGLPKYIALATGTGAAIILCSILLLGREFGAVGVAFATTAGYIAMSIGATMLTRVAKLEIKWSTWAACWPEITVGAVALVCSTSALALPLGSSLSRLFAGVCLTLLIWVACLLVRPRPVHQPRRSG